MHTDTAALAIRAAACPLPDCLTDHTDPHDSGAAHYTPPVQAGPFTAWLDLDEDGAPGITLAGDDYTGHLDAAQADALLTALTVYRGRMTELRAELSATLASRGAR